MTSGSMPPVPSTSPRNSTKVLKKIQSKTVFGKKETNIKKVKVFCDPSTSAPPKIQGKESGVVQVPRKRIKISSQQPKVEHLNLFENIVELNQIVCKSKCESTFGSLSMPNFFPATATSDLTVKTNQISFSTVDLLNSPCCSNLQKSIDLGVASTSCETKNLSTTKSKISNIPRIVNKKKFEKTSASLNKIGDSTKIKKKRILKTDSGLKRKKIRAKSVWH